MASQTTSGPGALHRFSEESSRDAPPHSSGEEQSAHWRRGQVLAALSGQNRSPFASFGAGTAWAGELRIRDKPLWLVPQAAAPGSKAELAVMLTANELIEMATQIERSARSFYTCASKCAGEAPANELLARLAASREGHELRIGSLTERLVASGEDVLACRYGDAALCFKMNQMAMCASELASETQCRPVAPVALSDIMRMAASFERDSLAFYEHFERLLPTKIGAYLVNGMVGELRSNLASLESGLARFSTPAP